MLQLRKAEKQEFPTAMDLIDMGSEYLKVQRVNQWQTGYPDKARIEKDIEEGKEYLLVNEDEILGYLCIDYDGEPAYGHLNGEWKTADDYVVVHRLALSDQTRGKVADIVFRLVEEQSRNKGIYSFRIGTDQKNRKICHILVKNGLVYRGTIWVENSVKIAFDKKITA